MLSLSSFRQNEIRREINGKLLTSTTENMFLETVYVYNKQSRNGVLSDSLGNFKIAVRVGDTVAVSAVHIEPNFIVVERMHLNDWFIGISTKLNRQYLDEVLLSNRSLTGALLLDLTQLPTNSIITSTDLGFPVPKITGTIEERMISSMKISTSGIPLDIVFAALNGELKQLKKRISVDKKAAAYERVLNRMPNSFYTTSLGLKEQDIPHFIDFCQIEKSIPDLEKLTIEEFTEYLGQQISAYRVAFPERVKE